MINSVQEMREQFIKCSVEKKELRGTLSDDNKRPTKSVWEREKTSQIKRLKAVEVAQSNALPREWNEEWIDKENWRNHQIVARTVCVRVCASVFHWAERISTVRTVLRKWLLLVLLLLLPFIAAQCGIRCVCMRVEFFFCSKFLRCQQQQQQQRWLFFIVSSLVQSSV